MNKIKLPQKKALIIILSYVTLTALLGFVFFLHQQSQSKAAEASNKVYDLEKQLGVANEELDSTKQELSILKDTNGENNINKERFQSIFLKNGQVYFGKITKITSTQITLENIYYLQEDGESLVKLGAELHGPEDVMYIERVNVEFWENLRSDSEVSNAIKVFETQNP